QRSGAVFVISGAPLPSGAAGVQFSKTLIDFDAALEHESTRWGSVLKNPDRLRKAPSKIFYGLGFSSQKP
ncbi:hypothetical protein ACQX2G_06360, partial [Corynebacterium diphtheriae]